MKFRWTSIKHTTMRHRISIEIHDTIFIENWKPFYILHIIFPYTPDMISLPSFVGTKATEWLGVVSFVSSVCNERNVCICFKARKEPRCVRLGGKEASNAGSQNENMKRCFSNLAARMALRAAVILVCKSERDDLAWSPGSSNSHRLGMKPLQGHIAEPMPKTSM